jgi:hypothetical protein
MLAHQMRRFHFTIACSLAIAVWWGAPSPAWAAKAPVCKVPLHKCKKDLQCCPGLICGGGGRCVPGCRIGGVMYAPGDTNDACKSCEPSVSTTGFSTSPDGTTCTGNADVCHTPPFLCAGGACVGQARDCTLEAGTCTVNSCDPIQGCQSKPVLCPPVTDTPGQQPPASSCYRTNCDPIRDLCVEECAFGTTCNDGGVAPCSDTPGCVPGVCETVTGPMGQTVQRCSNDPATPCNNDVDCRDIDCRDNNPCTQDVCDTTRGLCIWTPVSCDDGDVCTSDFCDAVLGCQHIAAPAFICDDGIACTQDSCANNACINTPTCDDGDPCTNDSCSLTLGQCTHTSACDDGNPCTTDLCRLKDNGTLSCKHVRNNCSG